MLVFKLTMLDMSAKQVGLTLSYEDENPSEYVQLYGDGSGVPKLFDHLRWHLENEFVLVPKELWEDKQ